MSDHQERLQYLPSALLPLPFGTTFAAVMGFPFLAPTNTKSTMLLDGVTTNVALTPSVTLLSPAGISCFICARAICEQKNRPASAIMAVLFIFLIIFPPLFYIP